MQKSLFVGCLVLLIAGCAQKPPSTPTSAESPSKSVQLSQESQKTPAAAQSNVELINAGTEPKQQLRFTPGANTKQTLQMTMDMDMAMSVGGQTQPAFDSPPIKMTMESEVKKVDANGDIHTDFSYSDADVVAAKNTQPQLVNAMRAQVKKLVGLRGSMIVDNQGNTKQANFNAPETLDPNTKKMVEQMVTSLKQLPSPVPSEAVGVGAKWKIPNSVTANGMTMNQSSTYELVDIKDNVASLQVSMEQQAGTQKINPQGLPPGASIDLKSMNSQGNGKLKLALNQVMPISSTMSMRSKSQMSVKEPNTEKATAMDMNVSVEMALESK
jgi:hypothetical protein